MSFAPPIPAADAIALIANVHPAIAAIAPVIHFSFFVVCIALPLVCLSDPHRSCGPIAIVWFQTLVAVRRVRANSISKPPAVGRLTAEQILNVNASQRRPNLKQERRHRSRPRERFICGQFSE